jgi:hypothetical protein
MGIYIYIYAQTTLHSKTTPFWARPKRRRFGQNGVVLHFRFFFFFFFFLKKKKEIEKKKKKKKKKEEEIGVAGATPFPKVGWPDHPIFGQGGGSNHPQRSVWGGRSHPQALGGGPATPKGKKKKKKKTKECVLAFGGGRTTP